MAETNGGNGKKAWTYVPLGLVLSVMLPMCAAMAGIAGWAYTVSNERQAFAREIAAAMKEQVAAVRQDTERRANFEHDLMVSKTDNAYAFYQSLSARLDEKDRAIVALNAAVFALRRGGG